MIPASPGAIVKLAETPGERPAVIRRVAALRHCGAPVSDPARFLAAFNICRVGNRRSGGGVKLPRLNNAKTSSQL